MYGWYIPRKCIDITTISTTIYTLLITEDVTGGFVTLSDTVTLKTVCSLDTVSDTDMGTTTIIDTEDTDIDITDTIGKQQTKKLRVLLHSILNINQHFF